MGLFQPWCGYTIGFPSAVFQVDRVSVPAWGQQKWGFLSTLGAEGAQPPCPSWAVLGLGERVGCEGRGRQGCLLPQPESSLLPR